MAIKQSRSAAYGDQVTGSEVYACPSTTYVNYQVAPVEEGVPTTAPGWGSPGQRVWGRPGFFTFTAPELAKAPTVGVTIATQAGAFVGRIRSDVQRTTIRSIEFTLDDHGCGDFKIVLNELPKFPVPSFARVFIRLGDTLFNWYCGTILNQPELGTKNGDGWEITGFGLRKFLEKSKEDKDYVAVTDIGVMVDDLAQNYIQPRHRIGYNPGKIDNPTGVLTANPIELTKHSLQKVLDNFGIMAQRYWGVDGDGDLTFENPYAGIKKVIYVGYGMESFQPRRNVEAVRNSIFVQRAEGKGSGASGWVVETIQSDTTSIAKYGKQELNYQVPATMGNAECLLIAQRLLEKLKDPPIVGEAKGVPVSGSADYYSAGTYRIVMPPGEFDDIVSECDSTSGWAKTGAGDLTINADTTFFASGAGSIRLNWTSAVGDIAQITLNPVYSGFIRRLRVWVRGSKTGNLFRMGVGNATWNQYTVMPAVNVAGEFVLVDWDLTPFNVRRIARFGIEILDPSLTAGVLHIDKIEAQVSGHKIYDLQLKKAKYRLTPEAQVVDLEFGEMPPKMENYIAGLMATSQEMKFTGEVR